MKDNELKFDRNCHVLYSKKCRKAIEKYIAVHYPENKREEIFTAVQHQFENWLKTYRTDLGGKKNFHNGTGGTYDNIMVLAYYEICSDVTSFDEIEELYGGIFLDSFKKLSFVNCNKKLYKKLMYKAFTSAKKRCDKWHDYEMDVEPYRENEPIRYRLSGC